MKQNKAILNLFQNNNGSKLLSASDQEKNSKIKTPISIVIKGNAYNYPQKSEVSVKSKCTQVKSRHYTIGDLHGNSLALLNYLIHCGVIILDDSLYDKLRDLTIVAEYHGLNAMEKRRFLKNLSSFGEIHERVYKQITEGYYPSSASELIIYFEELVAKITINSQARQDDFLITFLGDMLSDRGQNDFLSLIILKKLKQAGVKYEIAFSNHDKTVIHMYFANVFHDCFNYSLRLKLIDHWGEHQQRSFENCVKWLNNEPDLIPKFTKLFQENYLDNLQLVCYNYNGDGQLSIGTHAPFDLCDISFLIEYMQTKLSYFIKYYDFDVRVQKFLTIKDIKNFSMENVENLKFCLDIINHFFANIKYYHLNQIILNDVKSMSGFESDNFKQKNIISTLIWSRCRPPHMLSLRDKTKINFKHGHHNSIVMKESLDFNRLKYTDIFQKILLSPRLSRLLSFIINEHSKLESVVLLENTNTDNSYANKDLAKYLTNSDLRVSI